MIDVGFRQKLQALIPTVKVFQNVCQDHRLNEFVIFGRDGREQDLFYDGSQGMITDTFGVDIRSETMERTTEVSDAIRTLHGFFGDLPNGLAVSSVMVEDQAEDYVPRTADGIDGLHVCSLKVEVAYNPQ